MGYLIRLVLILLAFIGASLKADELSEIASVGDEPCDRIEKLATRNRCLQIFRAMNQAAQPMTSEEVFHHATSRLGYGANPMSRLQATNENIKERVAAILARSLARTSVSASESVERKMNHLFPGLNRTTLQIQSAAMTGNCVMRECTQRCIAQGIPANACTCRYDGVTYPDLVATKAALVAPHLHGILNSSQPRQQFFRMLFASQVEVERDGVKTTVDRQLNLNEVLVEFWMNHFNVDYKKVNRYDFGSDGYEYKIRSKVFTSFEELLLRVVTSPGMLRYLDNDRNVFDPVTKQASNQNLARELLELHTFGTGPKQNGSDDSSPYSQSDIEEVAKILTGVNFVEKFDCANLRMIQTGYVFQPLLHIPDNQPAPKPFGIDFNQKGEGKLKALVKHLAAHGQTRRAICSKLTSHLAPSPVAEGRQALRQACIDAWGSDGDLPAMYAAIVSSPEFWDQRNYKFMVKNPVEALTSMIRLGGVSHSDLHAQPDASRRTEPQVLGNTLDGLPVLGLPFRRVDIPTGYANSGSDWLAPSYIVNLNKVAFGIFASLEGWKEKISPYYSLALESEVDALPGVEEKLALIIDHVAKRPESALSDKQYLTLGQVVTDRMKQDELIKFGDTIVRRYLPARTCSSLITVSSDFLRK